MQSLTLWKQHLPCPSSSETLTLIHGWGAESAVWLDWAEQLAQHLNVVLIDLPGFGHSPACEENLSGEKLNAVWLEALTDQLPQKTHLLGWSLGGLLAQELALRHPEKVQSLICLASTPRFIQNDGWQYAVNPTIMTDFIKMLGIEYGAVLKRFWKLQLQGSSNARTLMKRLSNHMKNRSLPSYQGLRQGLYLLRDIDNRDRLESITVPTLWLLGEHDPLIPQQLISDLSQLQQHSEVEIIKGASHMPFFSHPEETAHSTLDFIQRQQG